MITFDELPNVLNAKELSEYGIAFVQIGFRILPETTSA